MRKPQSGFTLIEIAIVLVIIGLLLGGVLKGQELITAARVRNIISNQDGVKAAYFGFLDRYRALPGDYSQATANIPGCAACQNGDGNGQILLNGAILESISAWEHLSRAGFITGSYTYSGAPTPTNTPTNPYGSLTQLIFDAVYEDAAPTARHNLKTGSGIPSDIMAEVDRKIDDGVANAGQLRYANFGTPGSLNDCAEAAVAPSTNRTWKSATSFANCSATTLF